MSRRTYRAAIVAAALVAVVVALFRLDLDAESGTRLVTGFLSFLAAWVARPMPPPSAGATPSTTNAPAAAAPAAPVAQRALVGGGVWALAELVASAVGGA